MSHPPDRRGLPHLVWTQRALDVIAGRWVLNVAQLLATSPSPMRHRDLADALPQIAAGALRRTLQLMERDGLVRRHVEPSGPTQVRYQLTDVGTSAAELSHILADWAEQHAGAVEAARDAYRRSRKVLDVRDPGGAR